MREQKIQREWEKKKIDKENECQRNVIFATDPTDKKKHSLMIGRSFVRNNKEIIIIKNIKKQERLCTKNER